MTVLKNSQTPCRNPARSFVLWPIATEEPKRMSKISPCLWFNGDAEEAAKFYVSLLPVTLTDGESPNCEAWTYLYNWPVAHLPRIASGRFMEK